ncbi:hypothetical protein [Salinirubrum litoreum]|uniref:DUF4190 domain-containing protein n=1 Tax=Salinirubrum litoreum TaxID=1126234 RepID=A0ABD5RG10_9EURY|nr:hypothetical protein [Salinirubrum litoreum]
MHTTDPGLASRSAVQPVFAVPESRPFVAVPESVPSVGVPESVPLVTAGDSLLLVGLLLFAVGYVLAALVVTRWLYRDATRRGRPRPGLWTAAVGVSLLSGGLLGVVLLAIYLRGREASPTVASES